MKTYKLIKIDTSSGEETEMIQGPLDFLMLNHLGLSYNDPGNTKMYVVEPRFHGEFWIYLHENYEAIKTGEICE